MPRVIALGGLAAVVPLLLMEPAAAFHHSPMLWRCAAKAKNPPPAAPRMRPSVDVSAALGGPSVDVGTALGGFGGFSREKRIRSVAVMMSESGSLPAAESGKDQQVELEGKLKVNAANVSELEANVAKLEDELEEKWNVNVANVAEQQKVRDLREELARDDESSKASTETVEETMSFEEWKKIFGDVINPTKLKALFDQLDGDKNGRVSMREFVNGLDGFTGGTVHPLAVKGVLQSVRLKMLDKIQNIIRQKRRLKKLKSWSGVRIYSDYLREKWNDKEESRKYRRTIFTDEDWKRFRASGTSIFHNLQTMFNSRIIQGLWMEVACVFLVATTGRNSQK